MYRNVIVVLVIIAVGLWSHIIGSLNPWVISTDKDVTEEICKYKDLSVDWAEACRIAKEVS